MNTSPPEDSASSGPNTWIFQANPDVYRIKEALGKLSRFRWSIRQFRDQIKQGDGVFLWMTGSDGGCLARGVVRSDPQLMEELPEEHEFAAIPEKNASELRVDLEVTDRIKPPITRQTLLRHPVLKNMTFLRAGQGSNFRLTVNEAKALDAFCFPRTEFKSLMDRYRRDGSVFQSTERFALYCVSEVNEAGCEVARLTGNEPEHCSFSLYDKKLAQVREAGGRLPFLNLDSTAARRTTYLQGVELALSADHTDVLLLENAPAVVQNLKDVLAALTVDRSSGHPRLYKPALIACVIEGVLSGELTENRIQFDWILPRFLDKMKSLSQEAGPKQAAYAFFHLTSELFWTLCYNDPRNHIPPSTDASPVLVRERVRHAILKDTYWNVLADVEVCRSVMAALEEQWWPKTATLEVTDELAGAFQRFRANPVEQLRVRLRRFRAAQLRQILSTPELISLEQFNRDVWAFATSTLLDGQDWKGKLFATTPTEQEIEEFSRALDTSQIELHGNYVWNPGSSVFGPKLSDTEADKQDLVRSALRVLVGPNETPAQKSANIEEIAGFGPGVASGLVMLFHPDEFAIWNKQSKGAVETLGLTANDTASFQPIAKALRERVGAEDYLELDWFLYLVNQGQITVGTAKVDPSGPIGADIRYWAISLGEGGRLWNQCRQDGVAAIGWDYLGDLRKYANRDDIAKAMQEHEGEIAWPTNNSLACYQFCREMKPGHVVFVKQGRGRILGCGFIESDYEFDPERTEYRHVRRVRWVNQGIWDIPENARVPVKTLTEVTAYHAFINFARPLLSQAEPDSTEPVYRPPYTIDQALAGVFLSREEFRAILASMGRKKNAILQGPPGVGKTFLARRLAYHLIGHENPAQVMTVQFHQSYAYEDFVQGWRPTSDGGFERRNGVFYDFCQKAAADPESKYVFIIDEINRGNLSKIFGELFMLIEADKRGARFAIPLTYAKTSEDAFFVPENLYLLGLMNTADRSLAMVDYALRRRFAFLDLRPAFSNPEFQSFLEAGGVECGLVDRIVSRMKELNELIHSEKTHLGSGFEVGHSFFCPQGTEDSLDLEWYRSVVRTEIAPLVREYWFDDPDKAEGLIGRLLE